ncbi:MAG: hypothetical protein ACLPY1_02315 [Terracidiphilus sp.]
MRKGFVFLVAALCVGSYAMAASPSIGSVTSRGELKIDNYVVAGSGTVFDGSVVETGRTATSIADLRLGNDATISLYVDSRGTLHRNRFELQRGTVEVSSTSSFRVEVNGLSIATSQAHASGEISIEPGNSVKVVAKTGDLDVKDAAGRTIAFVHPGHSLEFSSLGGKPSTDFMAAGVVSSENGHYYLKTSETDVKYELKGDNLRNFDGSSVVASGTLVLSAEAAPGAAGVIETNKIDLRASSVYTFPGQSAQSQTLIEGLSIAQAKPAVSGSGGGNCKQNQMVPCCPVQPAVLPLCCPGFLYPSDKCRHSY